MTAIESLKDPKGWGVGGGDSRYPGADLRGMDRPVQTPPPAENPLEKNPLGDVPSAGEEVVQQDG